MKILYGVPGEGMGHATRSKVIIDFLLRENDVRAVSSSRAFGFLSKNYPGRVEEIKGFHFAYKDSKISKKGTFLLNVARAPRNLKYNISKYKKIKGDFHPDLVITDFESFSYYFAKAHRIPVISIDNMQVIDRCRLGITVPKKEKRNFEVARLVVKAKAPGCDHYFISSFFPAAVRKSNTTLVPPVIRKEILDAVPSFGKHVLVYQTSSASSSIKAKLKRMPGTIFYVYGMNKEGRDGNIIYKSFSETGFVKDLASARAVIANGGYSLISEAVYLKKPVYSFPLENQFEQFVNAAYIQKLGYGMHAPGFTVSSIEDFLSRLDHYASNLSSYKQDGNEVLFSLLSKAMQNI